MADKGKVIAEVEDFVKRAVAVAESLSLAETERTVYADGWNVRQVFCHLASLGIFAQRMIERAQVPQPAGEEGGGSIDIDAWNARQVAKRQDLPLAQLVEELRSNHQAVVEMVGALPEDVLAAQVPGPHGMVELGGWLSSVIVGHNMGHVDDVERSLGRR